MTNLKVINGLLECLRLFKYMSTFPMSGDDEEKEINHWIWQFVTTAFSDFRVKPLDGKDKEAFEIIWDSIKFTPI